MQTVSYMGDGSTTEFNFNFPYYENTNIIVTKNNAPATGYQIIGTSGGADADIPYVGGKVVFEVAPTSLDNIIISRQLPLSRAIDYQPTAHIDPTTLNQDMNYMIEVLKDFLDELEIFHNQYADIADKTSTQTLLDQIATINQMVANGEIMKVDKFHSCMANCITYIPQDINLTLASGAITLKAGSKVYIPNGSGTFDTLIIDSDKTNSDTTKNGKMFLCVNQSGTLTWGPVADSTSGAGATPQAGMAFAYDTTANTIKRYGDATTLYSFPIAICTLVAGTGITSIDQVFNGIGYIGSNAFVLPGLKGLIPNGRNTDGTLKNTEFTVSALKTTTLSGTGIQSIRLSASTLTSAVFVYDEVTNYNYLGTIDEANKRTDMIAGTVTTSSGAITSMKPKTSFHAVDYSNSDYIANCAMPSKNRYIDLTLGASGAAYTAPADGYIKITKNATAAGQYLDIYTTDMGVGTSVIAAGAQALRGFCPVAKGDRVTVSYTAAGATGTFRFVYANGAK